MQVYNDELYHYGKLGMKWGRHKTVKNAKDDAHEFARAKMFYGKGAGTRRKLIKDQKINYIRMNLIKPYLNRT